MRLTFLILAACLVGALIPPSCLAEFPPSFFQAETVENDCGQVALQVCAKYHGLNVDRGDICSQLPADGKMVSLATLAETAEHYGLETFTVRWSHLPTNLDTAPAILPINLRGRPHFVVATRLRGERFLILDIPNAGWVDLSRLQTEFDWNGYCLHIAKDQTALFPVYWQIYKWDIVQVLLLSLLAVVLFVLFRRNRRTSGISSSAAATTCLLVLFSLTVTGCNASAVDSTTETIYLKERVSFVPAEVTLTSAEPGKPAHTILKLRNSFEQPVKLLNVKSSCGCAVVDVPPKQVLLAGEEVSIPIEARIPEFGSKTTRVSAVVAYSGETSVTSSRITLLGARKTYDTPQISNCPQVLSIHRSAKGVKPTKFRIRTYEQADSEPWIQRLSCEAGSINIDEVSDSDQGDHAVMRDYQCRLEVETTDQLKASSFVSVQTSDGSQIASLALRLQEWSPLLLSPAKLLLAPGQSKTVRGIWTDTSAQLIDVSIESLDDRIVAEVKSINSTGKSFEIDVSYGAETGQELSGSTVIRIGCEHSATVTPYTKELCVVARTP